MKFNNWFKANYSRWLYFICTYLFIYIVPTIVIYVLPLRFARLMPRLMINYLFFLPQYAIPFRSLMYGDDPSYGHEVLGTNSGFVVALLYFISLGVLFSLLTRSVHKRQSLILFAFCFSILSIIFLNLLMPICGINVALDGP